MAQLTAERGPGRPAPAEPFPAMPLGLRIPFAVLGALAALVLAVLAIRYAGESRGDGVDRWIQERVVFQPDWALRPAVWVDFLGEALGLALMLPLAATVCLALRRPRLAVLAVAAPLISGAVTTALKAPVGRTINGGFLAYPSGHTAALTAVGMVLALLVVSRTRLGPRAGFLLVVTTAVACGAAMGWAQVYLVAHYPTDTAGGLCTALVVVPAMASVSDAVVVRFARVTPTA